MRLALIGRRVGFVLNVCSFDCDHASDSRGERKVAFTLVLSPIDWRFPPRGLLFPQECFLKLRTARVLRMAFAHGANRL